MLRSHSLLHRIHISIHIHTLALQIFPRLLNLRHQLLVGLRNVIEGENSVAEFAQEIGAEGDEGPEGELFLFDSMSANSLEEGE